jgi:hypothetical protein
MYGTLKQYPSLKMSDELKEEALAQIEMDVLFGFESKEELSDGICDMFCDEEDVDEEWLRQVVAQKIGEHKIDSLTWPQPTDFEKLVKAFDALILQKIVCLHKAGNTKQNAISDCEETVEKLSEAGIKATGYCFYHAQDLERAVDPEIQSLFLGFDSVSQNDDHTIKVGRTIVQILQESGFEVVWNGTVEKRIEIKNMIWQKLPDEQNWGMERVIEILTKPDKKKPFWKFW